MLNPKYVLGAVGRKDYETYKIRNRERALACYKAMTSMMTTNSLVKIKEKPPYSEELEVPVLMNSLARTSLDEKTGSYSFTKKLPKNVEFDSTNVEAAAKALSIGEGSVGVGVDHELISAVPSHNPTFVSRNFTDAEVAYCQAQADSAASFAARWAGKEAVFKSLGVSSKGAGAAMKDIEILPDESGVPTVTLHGDALSAAQAKVVTKVHLSLSHSETAAIAFAQAISS